MAIRLWGSRISLTGHYEEPEVTVLPNGGYVIAWTSGPLGAKVVQFQCYSATGVATSPVVTTAVSGDQKHPSVSVLSDGNIYITQDDFDTATDHDIEGYVYTQSGTLVRSQHVATTAAYQSMQDSISFENGQSAVAYVQGEPFATLTDIYIQKMDSNGVATGAPMKVNATTGTIASGGLRDPFIAASSEGSGLVLWNYQNVPGNYTLLARPIVGGEVVQNEFGLTTSAYTGQADAVISGNYVYVVYGAVNQSVPSEPKDNVALRVVNRSGFAVGPEIIIAGNASYDISNPQIEKLSSGMFVVGYTSTNGNGTRGIWIQVLRPDGVPSGEPKLVAEDVLSSSIVLDYTLAVLADDRIAVTWEETDNNFNFTGDTYANCGHPRREHPWQRQQQHHLRQ